MEKCFGYNKKDELTPLLIFDGSKLGGIDMRYFSHGIDPITVIYNLSSFLNIKAVLKNKESSYGSRNKTLLAMGKYPLNLFKQEHPVTPMERSAQKCTGNVYRDDCCLKKYNAIYLGV